MSETLVLNRPAALAAAGLIDPARLPALEAVAARYAVAVTRASAALIDPADPLDPVGLQFLPQEAELETAPDEIADPIGDLTHSPLPGVTHRYPDRVLLMPTNVCASYCRFCFRRERVGPGRGTSLTPAQLEDAIAYVAERPQIWEVILTGGDPFVLSARRLGDIMGRLGAINHVRVVRLHTRVPAVAPERVTRALVAALKRSGKAVFVALHANHPRELTPDARAACARLIDAGIPMLSQSVLLRGVNDDAQVLGDLMRAFVETRIRPYYLHHGDAAPGTAHLRVSLAEGQALVRSLRGLVSGLAQPTFVLDIPGGHGKVPVGPGYVSDDGAMVEDPWGAAHALPG
jgi:lysine 2,3-aminomutase